MWSVPRDRSEAGVGPGVWGPRPRRASGSPHGPKFFFTALPSHYFYLLMERWIPPEVPLAAVRRLLPERLLFAPAFLCLFFVVMNFLEVGLCCSTWDSSSFGSGILSLASVGGIHSEGL